MLRNDATQEKHEGKWKRPIETQKAHRQVKNEKKSFIDEAN